MNDRDKVLALISDVFRVDRERLTPETHLVADLGADSARALHMLVKLEDELEIEIEDEDVGDLQTVGDILGYLEQRRSAGGA